MNIDMKRLILISGLLLTLFLLVACGGSAEPAAVESQAESPVETASEPEIISEVEVVLPEPVIPVIIEEIVAEEVVEVEAVEVVEEMIEEEVVETLPEEAIVEEAEPAVVMAEAVGPADYQMIGQTGRPQFLNSYADW
ncbi:MAG: hypothetical protein ACI9EW_000799 [Cellvibrionaceae bacterium]